MISTPVYGQSGEVGLTLRPVAGSANTASDTCSAGKARFDVLSSYLDINTWQLLWLLPLRAGLQACTHDPTHCTALVQLADTADTDCPTCTATQQQLTSRRPGSTSTQACTLLLRCFLCGCSSAASSAWLSSAPAAGLASSAAADLACAPGSGVYRQQRHTHMALDVSHPDHAHRYANDVDLNHTIPNCCFKQWMFLTEARVAIQDMRSLVKGNGAPLQ
jgi:hypothetical protein